MLLRRIAIAAATIATGCALGNRGRVQGQRARPLERTSVAMPLRRGSPAKMAPFAGERVGESCTQGLHPIVATGDRPASADHRKRSPSPDQTTPPIVAQRARGTRHRPAHSQKGRCPKGDPSRVNCERWTDADPGTQNEEIGIGVNRNAADFFAGLPVVSTHWYSTPRCLATVAASERIGSLSAAVLGVSA